MPAIGGLDAHQSGLRVRGRVLSPMRYDRYFGLLQTHVLVHAPPHGTLPDDRELLYGALREGRCFLALDAVAPARGFRFHASAGGRSVAMGAQAPPATWTVTAELPADALVRLMRDGAPIAEETGRRLEVTVTEPGAYRIEARRRAHGRDRTWIVSNPIYLR